MSETKHTPGPWEAAGCVVYGSDGDSVADLSLNGRRHPDVTEANTRLTAAAPDLLEACEAALNALYDIIRSEFATSRNPHPADDDPDIAHLRAAIAKAKGGE